MKRIILLNGPPGCGKDTIAEYLVGQHSFTHLKFASVIVDVMRVLFNDFADYGHSYESFKKSLIGENGESGRDLMIEFSEGFVKKTLGNDFWIMKIINEIRSMKHKHSVVISDTGFLNEVSLIKNHFDSVELWRIIRDGHTFHCDSRQYISAPDVTIVNNSTTHTDLFSEVEKQL